MSTDKTIKYSRYYMYVKPVLGNTVVRSVAPYIFSLITMTIFIPFVIRPTTATIVQLQKNIEDNKGVLDSLNKKEQDLTMGKQNLDALSDQSRQKILAALPNQPNIPVLVATLQKARGIASASALQVQPVTIIDTTTASKKKVLGEIGFSYNVQGTYSNLLVTLKELEKSSRLIKIDSVVISKQEDGQPILSVNGKAFYLR